MTQFTIKKLSTCLTATFMLGLCSTLLVGCSSPRGGRFDSATGTGVHLGESNYSIVKANAVGTSKGFRLLGILPFSNPSYSNAKSKLYDSVGEDMRGRSIALSNQSEDRSTLYLILFSIPKITLSADVIEFNKDEPEPTVSTPVVQAIPAPAPQPVTETVPAPAE